jgi:hypothetical protein
MKIISIIENLELAIKNPVICFTGKEFPLLFFSVFKQKLNESKIIKVKSLDVQELKLDILKSELSSTFLGTKLFYWLGNIDNASSRLKEDIILFVSEYKGPNVISFFTSENFNIDSGNGYNFLCEIEKKYLYKFYAFITGKTNNNLDLFFKNFDSDLNIDSIILLFYYFNVLGSRFNSFFLEWKDRLIKTESSLFTLTSLFFSKSKTGFFKYWYKIKISYPDTFWTVFWLDQSFRAYWFLEFKKNKDFKNLKRISFKLPFSFINGDFRKNNSDNLLKLQDSLYLTDCSLKLGLGINQLELALVKYINS